MYRREQGRQEFAKKGSITTSPDSPSSTGEDARLDCLDHIHSEPEFVDFRWKQTGEDTRIICAEDRARVESYLLALEGAEAPAYALMSSIDALVGLMRRTGVFEGDGLLLRVRRRWTDAVFLDGSAVRHLGLPVGERDLEDESETEQQAESF